MTAAPDVVVVGGGPIGLASAWRAAQAGLDVTVCDPAPGSGAADVAAGMLAAVTEAWFGEEALSALTAESARRWPKFAAEVEAAAGSSVGFEEGGTLLVAHDVDDLAVVDRLLAYQHDLGLAVDRLRPQQLRELEPALSPQVRGGALAGSDHRVDPRALCTALLEACLIAGVQLQDDRVARIDVEGDRATGVTLTAGGTIATGAVVLAAGAWSAQIGGLPPDAAPPVRPVKGEVITLQVPPGSPPLLHRAVRGYVQGSTVYLVPRDDGRVVIGATAEERGFDATVTAGAMYQLLRDATILVPGIDELEVVEMRAGLRPGSPDNTPIVGWGALDGLLVATGHYRNGILLTPLTADAVASLLTGGEPPAVMKACDPGRFG
ncbi:MAG: glycine oxidase ThiO [Acidimicrobiales bacterium]